MEDGGDEDPFEDRGIGPMPDYFVNPLAPENLPSVIGHMLRELATEIGFMLEPLLTLIRKLR